MENFQRLKIYHERTSEFQWWMNKTYWSVKNCETNPLLPEIPVEHGFYGQLTQIKFITRSGNRGRINLIPETPITCGILSFGS